MLRSFLPRKEVRRLRSEVVNVFDRTPADKRAGCATVERAEMFRYEMFNRSARCQRMIGHPRILEVIEPLIGNDCHVIACTAWRNPADPAHAPQGQEWHTDAGPHIPRSPEVEWPHNIPYPVFTMCVHVFLDACGPRDGPTAVIPRSHKSGQAPPKEREFDVDLDYRGAGPRLWLAEPGDVGMFVSDIWHRRMPPMQGGEGRFFLQINYARRDIAQRVLPTSEVNHTRPGSRKRAVTERERMLIGLHPESFYDG